MNKIGLKNYQLKASIFQSYVYIVLLLYTFMSCKSALRSSSEHIELSDKNADKEVGYLMARIKEVSKTGYAFGHQDATAYGIGWKNDGAQEKSDVNEVAGDFPGVYGFELGHLELGHTQNLDTVNFELMANLIRVSYEKGGIVTISWHPNNPTTLDSAWDPTTTVHNILEEGILSPKYKGWLNKLASFLNSLKTKSGKPIPLVFRPYHEMNGTWFWWGSKSCTPNEFRQLWRETFDILTKNYGVHNLIYCYSTDAVENKSEYLKYYPGDDYVDMLGIDLYHKKATEDYIELLNDNLGMLGVIAKEKKMPFALTESGLEGVNIADWWTEVLDKNVSNKGLSWVLVWRNASVDHYFAPFIGQLSSEDFVKFKRLPHVFFLQEMNKIR
ncbi:glycoside hydrolase family 26 protein [Flagellimonas sp. CMM7]|uniref:glycoside hydrolase family 26 protein n=1 Tax=Flagellimonas sp. CMM7 TaxID=2654676 RepID=UPI0013D08B73|nr:glycosyl hydrolase [Flagellimonas sp. CMM7]UII80362.1 glycoside hydrolase family 26 protein [Flagellimonas sp. CMM7]